jgi:cardiolipin synthase A/B
MHWLAAHLATVVVMLLVVPFLARILRDKRAPGSTFAWLLVVVAIPYLGIPLYLIVGPRKRTKIQKRIYERRDHVADIEPPVARLLCADGAHAPTQGNTVSLLETGETAFAKILELIDGAKRSIHITTFILGNDETGNTILAKLTERATAGVDVRLLIDGFFAFRASRTGIAALVKAGGRVATFGPLIHLPFRGMDNLRNHRKIALFDGASAVIGGMNLAEEYMGSRPFEKRWCDLCVHVRGPAVDAIGEVFRADWEFVTHEKVVTVASDERSGPTRAQVVASGPDSAADGFYDAVVSACYAAKRRIWIATPYFVPDDALTRALSSAARRSLDVLVMVPFASNHALADLAGGASLRTVEAAGGRIATFPRMLHAKAAVVDDDIAIVGSANFDMRSLFLDYEIAIFIYTPETVGDLASWFERRVSECGKLRAATALRSLGEDVGRLVAPLV